MVSNDILKSLKTAGVFVLSENKFAFMIGPNKTKDKLGIVRFGGHIENNENVFECISRELYEEASAYINIVSSPTTYYKQSWDNEYIEIIDNIYFNINPLIIVGDVDYSTVIFLGYPQEELKPSHETSGII